MTRAVNILGLVSARNVLNQATSTVNYRSDLNADGIINILDLVAIRNNLSMAVSGSWCP